MAGGSAVTWNEVASWVASGTAMWKGSAQSGNSCLTVTDFNAQVLNNGALANSQSLITYDQFMANKQVGAKLTNSGSVALKVQEYDNAIGGAPTKTTTLNAGATMLTQGTTKRLVVAHISASISTEGYPMPGEQWYTYYDGYGNLYVYRSDNPPAGGGSGGTGGIEA